VEPNRPAVLRDGDQVMLISPSGPLRPERLELGIKLLTDWGLQVALAPNVYASRGYLAGTDAQRLDDLNLALRDPQVRAVICTRGGYGVQRIVDGLDLAAVRADPKLVVGFSDITALQLALWQAARLPTVHGPGAAWVPERTGPVSAESLRRALMTDEPAVVMVDETVESAPVRVSGSASGVLLGGNLTMLMSTVGTVDMPSLAGCILLLEDVNEAPYKVDRMLTHLRRAGCLDGIVGVALGHFTDCGEGQPSTVVEPLLDHFGSAGIPVLGGLPIGHGVDQVTVALGTHSTLDADAGFLAVEAAGRR
jgi:muramoyltetrapeptide carboxypeptidase